MITATMFRLLTWVETVETTSHFLRAYLLSRKMSIGGHSSHYCVNVRNSKEIIIKKLSYT